MFTQLSLLLKNRNAGKSGSDNKKAEPEISEGEKSAIRLFFSAIEHALPELRKRGHIVLVKKGLLILLAKHPELEELASNLMSATQSVVYDVVYDKENLNDRKEKDAGKLEEFPNDKRESVPELGKLKFLEAIFSYLAEPEQKDILKRLKDELNPTQVDILNEIFSSRSTEDNSRLFGRYVTKETSSLMSTQIVLELINIMFHKPEHFRFQLGALLSIVEFSRLPAETKIKLKPTISSLELKIKPGHRGWWLCSEAEPRLAESMSHEAVVLVNGALLMKFVGKFSGLCVKNYITKDGFSFVEGNWYAPTDDTSRKVIRSAYNAGIRQG